MIENSLQLEEIKINKTIESREVAQMMNKRHDAILRMIDGSKDGKDVGIKPILEKANFVVSEYFIESSYKTEGNNKNYKCYECTKMGCEMLGNKLQGEKGILFSANYVQRFNELEENAKKSMLGSYAIEDKKARALKWIEEETIREQLEAKTIAQENIITELTPKAAFADAVSASGDSILVRELAKILKQNGATTGEKRLFEKLRQYGYLIRDTHASDYNQPTQRSMEKGLFELKRTVISSAPGSTKVSVTTKVTSKGVQYFVDKFLTGKMVLN